MIASFPWYDLQSVQWANDQLWQATGYPGVLVRDRPIVDIWCDPDLLVTQACGLDLFLSDAPIEPIAAPVFDLDCEAGMYFSYIIGNLDGCVAAVNAFSSRSGWLALLSKCRPASFIITGSHQASLEALSTGRADVAAIDAVTWHILERDAPAEIAGLDIVARSSQAPSPPYVIRLGNEREPLLSRLGNALASSQSVDAKKALLLKDIIPVQRRHYLPVLAEYQALRAQAEQTGEKNDG